MIDDFFSVNFIFAGLLIIIGLLFVSVFIYKLDTEQAVHEFQIQQKANEYKQEKITEDVINGKRIKA
jgi:predicted histidine transporter YuiF (NhaC family)